MELKTHSEIEQFKNNYKQRIINIAKSKTEWVKDFVESQKKKEEVKTVEDMIKEMNKANHLYYAKKHQLKGLDIEK